MANEEIRKIRGASTADLIQVVSERRMSAEAKMVADFRKFLIRHGRELMLLHSYNPTQVITRMDKALREAMDHQLQLAHKELQS